MTVVAFVKRDKNGIFLEKFLKISLEKVTDLKLKEVDLKGSSWMRYLLINYLI